MRHSVVAILLASVLVLIALGTVFAQEYISDAVKALEQAPVYVAPGTQETDIYTAGKLQARLTSGDNIVLVMLPATAEAELGVDITTLARNLSDRLGNRRIVGLAVGNKVVGYAPSLPVGVAADQMSRAQSVANDPVTALGTFVLNIHLWQREHAFSTVSPTPKPAATPTATPTPRPTPTITPTPDPVAAKRAQERQSARIGYGVIGVMGAMFLISVVRIAINLRKARQERKNRSLGL
jgi:hypothetical protein